MEANRTGKQKVNNQYWVDGNTVRKLQEVPDYRNAYKATAAQPLQHTVPDQKQEQRTIVQPAVLPAKGPKVRHGVDFISMTIMTVAILVTLFTCVQYLKVQSDTVEMKKSIAATQNELTNLKDRNDATYNLLASAVDLDYIYQTAVVDLGMVFPNQNQVLSFKEDPDGYVRQYKDIPEADVNSLLSMIMP